MKRHLSVTQLKMYLRCPLQYKYRYIDDLKIPPTSSLTLGKSIHSTLEENYRQKIDSGQDFSTEFMTDFFSDQWDKGAPETVFEEEEKPGKVKDDGIRLVRTYHETVSPTIQPVHVEREFNLDLENSDYTLKGFIDLVDRNSFIIDHKTAKKSWSEDQAAKDVQLTAYALAYRTLEGQEEKGLRFDVMVRTKEPKIQQLYTTRNQKDIDRFIKTLAHVYKAIETGIFYPNENWMCPSCGYKPLCEKW